MWYIVMIPLPVLLVQLMSKMAPLLGKEMTERVFLARFCEMCGDPLFHVRKVGYHCRDVRDLLAETFKAP